jgi:hypothetical protein
VRFVIALQVRQVAAIEVHKSIVLSKSLFRYTKL